MNARNTIFLLAIISGHVDANPFDVNKYSSYQDNITSSTEQVSNQKNEINAKSLLRVNDKYFAKLESSDPEFIEVSKEAYADLYEKRRALK